MPTTSIRHFIGQAASVAFGFLAFVCLAGAAITIGELGTPGSDFVGTVRKAFIAMGMSAVFFGAGYSARRLLNR
jgi:hypothetical protein